MGKNYSKMVKKKSEDIFKERIALGLEVAKDKFDPTYPDGENYECLVLLNQDNSKIVERAISDDDAYIDFIGVVSDWARRENHHSEPENFDRKTIVALARIVDFVNSTDVWVHSQNSFYQIVNFILDKTDKKKAFWNRLRKGDLTLVTSLSEASKATVLRKRDGKKQETEAMFPSFASKICKYFSQCILGKDSYYINDQYVRRVLPYYYSYYLGKTARFKANDYESIHGYLAEIHAKIEESGESLTKTELDHIMWYCYKAS